VSRLLAAEGRDAVPLLLGATANEWGILALVFPPPQDRQGYRSLLARSGESRVERLLELYPAASDDQVPAAATRFLGDRNFVCPTRYAAGRRRGRTWLYLASAPPAPGPAAARYGAFHGSDVRLLFGHEMGVPLGEVGRRVSDAMRRYWTRFAATGDPNQPGLPAWPAYEGASPRHLELGEEIRAVTGLGRPGCDVLDEARDASPRP
jgi:para-nitrobenzyl esterase